MKILVVGAGGREHAIIKKLKENPEVTEIFACPGNGGIAKDAECVNISATDLNGITDFAVKMNIDFCVVAPDDPLVLGLVDILESKGIPCFGPSKKAAIIEGSKVFSKNLMKKYGIPTAAYESFHDEESAAAYVRTQEFPVVIKADGLASGKGVVIAQSQEEAEETIHSMMEGLSFGGAGKDLVIEEYMEGEEVSVLAFCDGKTIIPMLPSQDHKRIGDGDTGPNTGGMGAYAPAPILTQALSDEVMKKILRPTVDALAAEGCPFSGCLYAGLMITQEGPKVVEFNCRFGDPETQAVLPLLDGDLADIMMQCIHGTLDQADIRWKKGSAVCVVMAAAGYPQAPETGDVITGLKEAEEAGCIVFHAGTKKHGRNFVTAGGRILGVTGVSGSLQEAAELAYKGVEKIRWEGVQYRRDIAQKGLDRIRTGRTSRK